MPSTAKSTKLSLSGVISVSAIEWASRVRWVSDPAVSTTMKSWVCSTAVSASTNSVNSIASMEQTHDFIVVDTAGSDTRSEEHTSELQSHLNLVCRLLL